MSAQKPTTPSKTCGNPSKDWGSPAKDWGSPSKDWGSLMNKRKRKRAGKNTTG